MIRQNGPRSRRFSTKLAVMTGALCALAIATGCANPTEYDIVGDDGGTGSGNAPGLGGASNAGAPDRAGASSAGAGNSSSGGSAGHSAAGGPATGGSSSAGASSAGASSGGASAAGASSGGSAGQGSAGASTAGSSNNGGATGGTGCDAVAWASGKTYKVGDAVTATCNNPGGGSAVCSAGKKYAWTCMGSACTTFGAGGDAWWANWTLGAACN